jgi:hypothetical protein
MWAFVGVTVALFVGLVFCSAYMKREEIMGNWSKYRDHPLYMFAAPMFKPSNDPRSRLKFGTDNFMDVLTEILTKIFSVFLQPVFKIFNLFTGALVESLSGLFNIRALLGNMWNRFNDMTGIFMRRFNSVFHQLHVTFVKLLSAMDKTFAVAVSAVYEGLSTIHTITSFIDLLIKVVIIILVILVALVILLFFVLWPFIPLIMVVIGIISTTAFAGSVGGMASSFCFHGETLIHTVAGPVPLCEIKIGDSLLGGGVVNGCMDFAVEAEDLYELYGVQVSASHIVYTQEGSMHVSDHPDARKIPTNTNRLYCLITSNRVIPVESDRGFMLFADWEELGQHQESELYKWHRQVFTALNPGKEYIKPSRNILESEAVVSENVCVMTPSGPIEIREICPGDRVMDVHGKETRVTGVVRVDGSEVSHVTEIGDNTYISASTWIYNSATCIWEHPTNIHASNPSLRARVWYSLFTESGSYQIVNSLNIGGIRDFTDIGPDRIHETYGWILEAVDKI